MRNLKIVLLAMAAVLLLSGGAFSATLTLSPVLPAQMAPYVLEGVISALDTTAGSVTLVFPNTPQRLPEAFFVNNLTRILRNGQIAPLRALAVGDICRAEIRPTADNVPLAVNVQAKSPMPQLQVVRGKITVIDPVNFTFSLFVINDLNPQGAAVLFVATQDTVIRKNGIAVKFADLKVNDLASVGFVPNPTASPSAYIRAAVIEATSPVVAPVVLEGVIKNVDLTAGSVTLGAPLGAPVRPEVKFYVTDATRIFRNGVLTRLSALLIGDTCRAEVNKREDVWVATLVQAKAVVVPPPTPIVLEGFIRQIDATNKTIALGGPVGSMTPLVIVYVTSTTKIMKNGEPVTFSALVVGDTCRAEILKKDNRYVAISLQAKSAVAPPPTIIVIEGVIKALDATKGAITVGPAPTSTVIRPPVTFLVTSTTVITRNGVAAPFSALVVGDICRAEVIQRDAVLVANKVAAKAAVVVPPPPTVIVIEGVITLISAERSSITVGPAPGSTVIKPPVTFVVNAATVITRNGVAAPFSALLVGDVCRAEVVQTDAGLVAKNVAAKAVVVVPPPPTVIVIEGVITLISAEKSSITVGPAPGATVIKPLVTFVVNAATVITRNGVAAPFSALVVGDVCRAEVVQTNTGLVAKSVAAKAAVVVPPPLSWVAGKIATIDPVAMTFTLAVTSSGSILPVSRPFFADKLTRIVRNGVAVGFGDLKVSDFANVGFVPSPITTTGPVRAAAIEAKSSL